MARLGRAILEFWAAAMMALLVFALIVWLDRGSMVLEWDQTPIDFGPSRAPAVTPGPADINPPLLY